MEALGITLRGRFPLAWQSLTAPLADSVQSANEALLHSLNLLEETTVEGTVSADERPELIQIETRLNLLIDMVGELLGRLGNRPPECSVELASTSVVWQGDSLPPVGETVELTLWPHSHLPRPLRLSGQVVSADQGRCRVELDDPGEWVRDGLERLIFRHHRREVARQRATLQADGG